MCRVEQEPDSREDGGLGKGLMSVTLRRFRSSGRQCGNGYVIVTGKERKKNKSIINHGGHKNCIGNKT